MARVTMITYHALEFMTKGNLTQPAAAHLHPQGCNLRIDSGIFSVPRLGRAGTLHCLAVEGITYDQLGCGWNRSAPTSKVHVTKSTHAVGMYRIDTGCQEYQALKTALGVCLGVGSFLIHQSFRRCNVGPAGYSVSYNCSYLLVAHPSAYVSAFILIQMQIPTSCAAALTIPPCIFKLSICYIWWLTETLNATIQTLVWYSFFGPIYIQEFHLKGL